MQDHSDYTVSIHYDRRLYRQDIAGSKAHAAMLARQGIIGTGDADAIINGLSAVQEEIERGDFPWDPALEDLHMNIERRLTDLIGPAGARLHTGRSRNDQIALGHAPLHPRRHRRHGGRFALCPARPRRPGGAVRGRRDARLHSPAARPAGAFRPPHARLLRDATARRRPVHRLRCPHGRAPPG